MTTFFFLQKSSLLTLFKQSFDKGKSSKEGGSFAEANRLRILHFRSPGNSRLRTGAIEGTFRMAISFQKCGDILHFLGMVWVRCGFRRARRKSPPPLHSREKMKGPNEKENGRKEQNLTKLPKNVFKYIFLHRSMKNGDTYQMSGEYIRG